MSPTRDAAVLGTSRSLPRRSSRSTLLNVFGELAPTEAVPTGTLVHVLGEAGHERHAARQSISRCSRTGWVEGARRGRESWWSLTAEGRRLTGDGVRRVEALGRRPDPWDGRWLVLLVSIPQDIRSVRPRLYRSLSWAGFGSPVPGVWLSPYPDRQRAARRAVDRLELGPVTMSFVGSAADVGLTDAQIVERAWPLDEISAHYDELVGRFSGRRPRTGDDALRDLLDLDEELQRLPALDPQLPEELAPQRSGRDAARELLTVREAWLGPAREYWRSLGSPA